MQHDFLSPRPGLFAARDIYTTLYSSKSDSELVALMVWKSCLWRSKYQLPSENHKNFPPTYIAICEADPLRDDGKVMEECLKKAGVPVKSDYYEGLPHYFWIFPSVAEGQQFVGNLIGGCKWVVGQMRGL